MQWAGRILGVLILACLGAGIGASVVGRTPTVAVDKGRLAQLLADRDAARLQGLVARADQPVLSSSRLQTSWDEVVAATGPLRRVSRTVTVDEDGARDELELLAFAHGIGTLSAKRTGHGIVALWLLAGTSIDQRTADAGREYALDLATGDFAALRAAFDPAMSAALPPAQLASVTRSALRGLRGTPSVVTQLTVRRPSYTVVETYLLFDNGMRRVEASLDTDLRIAGLFIRPL